MAAKKGTASKYLNSKEVMQKLKTEGENINLMLLFGSEDYLIERTLMAVRKMFISPGSEDMDLSVIDGHSESFSFDRLEEFITTPAWMSSKRVVLVKYCNVFDVPFDDKGWKCLENIPSSCIVVIAEESVDQRLKSFKNMVSKAVVSEINTMDDETLIRWITAQFEKKGVSITQSAAQSIVNRCDRSMRSVAMECTKLDLYMAGIGRTDIKDEDVEAVCPPDVSGSVFTITDALGSGNAAAALVTLNNLIALKEPVIKIRVQFMRHIKKLLIAKEIGRKDEVAKRLSCHPFVAEKLVRQSSNFSSEQLLNLYMYATGQDVKIKSGEMEERSSLETMIVMAATRR